jgi:RNA polymerase sigma factor (sigma-70 family)
MSSVGFDDVWREQTPHVLAAVLRRHGDFAACEDAVQEALLAAARQWPAEGLPDYPRGWLIQVASRKLVDARRSDVARIRRERGDTDHIAPDRLNAPPADDESTDATGDETLSMLLLCADPSLSDTSSVALMLRAVAGLTTAQIAAGFLVPEATMAQRISRAKATMRANRARVQLPIVDDVTERLHAVRHALYLTFTAGHTRSSGDQLMDVNLAQEAIRITNLLHRALPGDTETAGLLALMLLTHSRAPTRVDANGNLVPLDQQDRARWDRDAIDRGTGLVERALPAGQVGPFQLQAAVAAVHAQAATAADTDWLQIVVLYRMLERITPSPTVQLNLSIAIGMAHGPNAGLTALVPLLNTPDQQRNHRLHSARAHLLELAGDHASARHAFRRAASLTASIPEQRYLNQRASS